jgi:hypothetical protein
MMVPVITETASHFWTPKLFDAATRKVSSANASRRPKSTISASAEAPERHGATIRWPRLVHVHRVNSWVSTIRHFFSRSP